MANDRHSDDTKGSEGNALSKSKMVLIGFLLVAAYFLFTEHRAHIISFLPFLLIAACLLMHIFMHGGHGGHGGQGGHGGHGGHRHDRGDAGNNRKGES